MRHEAGGEQGFEALFGQVMALLAAAESRARTAELAPRDRGCIGHALMETTAALLVLRGVHEGDLAPETATGEAQRLRDAPALAATLAGVPQHLRLALLPVLALRERLGGMLEAAGGDCRAAKTQHGTKTQNGRPCGHPRLHLVTSGT